MRNILELDSYSNIITDLGFDIENMYKEADASVNLELAEQLKRSNFDFYRELKEKEEPVMVRFTGFRRRNREHGDELFVIFDTIELVYPVERVVFEKSPDPAVLLEKEYKVYIRDVKEEDSRIILCDNKYLTKRQAVEVINEKLRKNEEVFLRGNIIGLQKNGGEKDTQMAAYVNIGGLGIIGVIPIKQWSVGYVATESFREMVENNVNAIVNFKVYGTRKIRYGKTTRTVFSCSRGAYLEKIDYDPWEVVRRTLSEKATVKVFIVGHGKSKDSYFGAIDGISDFNALCYVAKESGIGSQEVQIGKYYLGYVQKADYDRKFLRVRLTQKIDQGSELRKGSTPATKEE